MRNGQKTISSNAIDAINKIRAIAVVAQFMNCSDAEEQCRLDLLSIIEEICIRTASGEDKQ